MELLTKKNVSKLLSENPPRLAQAKRAIKWEKVPQKYRKAFDLLREYIYIYIYI